MFGDNADISFANIQKLFFPLTAKKAASIISIVGFLVFFNCLWNGFVWDDKTFILSNAAIHQFDFLALLGKGMFNSGGNYRPIPAIYFWSLYHVFGDVTFFYHIVELTLHISNTILVFVLFKKFLHKHISLFLALIFLVHPLQVESVSYIAASDNPLFFLLGMLALLISMGEQLTLKRVIIVCTLLELCVLTKETGFLFVLMILISRILFKKRKVVLFTIASFIIGLLYIVVRFFIGNVYFTKPEASAIGRLPFVERLFNTPAVVSYYITNAFFPDRLAIDQQWIFTKITFQHFFIPLFVVFVFFAIVIFLGVRIYKKNEENGFVYLFFFCWLVSGLGLHMQLFPLDMTVADRWFYFPLVGLLGMIGVFAESVRLSKKNIATVVYAGALVILLGLCLRTMIRNTNWYDALTLYSHDSNITTNYDLENSLGAEYMLSGQYPDAIYHFQKALHLSPYSPYYVIFSNLAHAYDQVGDGKNAQKYYLQTIHAAYSPSKFHDTVVQDAYERLGLFSVFVDTPEIAKKTIKAYLRKFPDSGKLWVELAMSEYKSGDIDQAKLTIQKAHLLLPHDTFASSLYNQITTDKSR